MTSKPWDRPVDKPYNVGVPITGRPLKPWNTEPYRIPKSVMKPVSKPWGR